jgi:hypothetical protein
VGSKRGKNLIEMTKVIYGGGHSHVNPKKTPIARFSAPVWWNSEVIRKWAGHEMTIWLVITRPKKRGHTGNCKSTLLGHFKLEGTTADSTFTSVRKAAQSKMTGNTAFVSLFLHVLTGYSQVFHSVSEIDLTSDVCHGLDASITSLILS